METLRRQPETPLKSRDDHWSELLATPLPTLSVKPSPLLPHCMARVADVVDAIGMLPNEYAEQVCEMLGWWGRPSDERD